MLLDRRPGRRVPVVVAFGMPRAVGEPGELIDPPDPSEQGSSSMRLLPLDPTAEACRALRDEAEREGVTFVARCVGDWVCGANRFERPGERLLGAWTDELVAMGGITIDPYTSEPGVGRLRHIYVRPAFRRQGLARALVAHLSAEAQGHFVRVRLRTSNPAAATLYESTGFAALDEPNSTHALSFAPRLSS